MPRPVPVPEPEPLSRAIPLDQAAFAHTVKVMAAGGAKGTDAAAKGAVEWFDSFVPRGARRAPLIRRKRL